MATKKAGSSKQKHKVGMSRGRRGVFLRIPVDLYDKLVRLAAARLAKGEDGTIQGMVMKLISDARA